MVSPLFETWLPEKLSSGMRMFTFQFLFPKNSEPRFNLTSQ